MKEKKKSHGLSIWGGGGKLRVYLVVYEINGTPRVDVHKINFSVVVDELCTPRHCVGEAALHLETQFRL